MIKLVHWSMYSISLNKMALGDVRDGRQQIFFLHQKNMDQKNIPDKKKYIDII